MGFLGFAHPAVITVAAVLVISRALRNAGIVDFAVQLLTPLRGREVTQLVAQNSSVALLSGFMNNVGAMALMLPVALRNAYREGYAPAKALMPLAFASLLGGLVTLVGTPPNIIIAAFRGEHSGTPFAMFDFAPVGLPGRSSGSRSSASSAGASSRASGAAKAIPSSCFRSRNMSPRRGSTRARTTPANRFRSSRPRPSTR